MFYQFNELRIIIEPLYTDNSYNSVNNKTNGNLEKLLSQAKNRAIQGIQDASGVYYKNKKSTEFDVMVENRFRETITPINNANFSNLSFSNKSINLNGGDLAIIPPTQTSLGRVGYYVQLARSIYMAITTSPTTLANITAPNTTPAVTAIATRVFTAIPKNKTAFTSAAGTVPVNPMLQFKGESGMLA